MRIFFISVSIFILSLGNVVVGAESVPRKPAGTFKDCVLCPEMVILPKSSSFKMGVHPSQERYPYEYPWHDATIDYSFAVGKFELLIEEFDACVNDGVCQAVARSNQPFLKGTSAYSISWADANSYVGWLSKKTGKPYRLLSHTEWEYAARAGTKTVYWWGDTFEKDRAVCAGCSSAKGRSTGITVDGKKIMSFSRAIGEYHYAVGGVHIVPANPFGLYFMLGNVREWVDDCFHMPGVGVRPEDGSPWLDGGDCSSRHVLGNDFDDLGGDYKLSNWMVVGQSYREVTLDHIGTRIALTLK